MFKVSSWYTPGTESYQLELLNRDEPILPWFQLSDKFDPKLRELVKEISARQLPYSIKGSQFEAGLSDKEYFERTENNPNCQLLPTPEQIEQGLPGSYERRVSPFGRTEDWQTVGRKLFNTNFIKELDNLYRDPPEILLVSNNEHPKLRWKDAPKYKDFVDRYGSITPNATREIIGNRYDTLYGWLFNGIKTSRHLKNKNTTIIGYNSYVPQFLGRYADWEKYSYHTMDYVNPYTYWDGTSSNYYTDSNGATDYKLWSTQVEFMNLVKGIDESRKERERAGLGKFHFELSIWNGGPDQIKKYTDLGQTYSLDRFEGWAQYGIWLTRPDTVRAFFPHSSKLEDNKPYFERLLDIANRLKYHPDRLYIDNFWRYGKLLEYGDHPYIYGKPKSWNAKAYMKLPQYKHPRDLEQIIDVFYLVYEDDKTYMVYAHSPLGTKKAQVELPIGTKEIEVGPEGGYFFFK